MKNMTCLVMILSFSFVTFVPPNSMASQATPVSANSAVMNAPPEIMRPSVVPVEETAEQVTDTALAARVSETLKSSFGNNADFPNGRNLQVTSLKGRVLIRGVVSSDDERRDMEAMALQMPGVLSVQNALVLYVK